MRRATTQSCLGLLPLAWCLVLSAAGCNRPFRTEDRLQIDGPVTVAGRISAEFEAKNNTNPLIAMSVDGRPCCPGDSKVALVDVDGLLLNQNLTGPYSCGENPVDLFREKLDAAAEDPRVCAVVLRLNSPGGSVTATGIL